MKKHIMPMVILFISSLALAACGAQQEATQGEHSTADGQASNSAAEAVESDATQPVGPETGSELSGDLMVWSLGREWFEWMSIAEERFEQQHPDVDVSIIVQQDESLFTLFPQAVQSDDKPDVAWFYLHSGYQDLARAGFLEPLDDLWESEWDGKFDPNAKNKTLVDGRSYGAALDMVMYPFLYYNKDIMAEADAFPANGLYYESNEEFLEAAQKIKDAGYEVFSLGAGTPGFAGHTFDVLLTRVMDEETLESYTYLSADTPPFTDPLFVKALELMAEWRDAGVFATGFETRSDEESRSLFTNGLAAWYQSGSWSMPTIASEEPDFEWGWMLFPQIDPAIGVPQPVFYGDGGVITKDNQNPEAAREFLKLLLSNEMQEELAGLGLIPTRLDVSPEALAGIGEAAEMLALLEEHGSRTGWDDPIPEAMMNPAHILQQQMLAGQIEPMTVAEEIDEIRIRLLNEP